eukprot:TRINITY_DN19168_c0_g1_i1.p1 TRINITY_DN19168_c0_g1~~TRINITY_DN19168_c0_g1_i1.p1  ORF type:complete len:463 (-),score=47.77 TRINITY_DN19168_c0_g1_i1:778-2166(-)
MMRCGTCGRGPWPPKYVLGIHQTRCIGLVSSQFHMEPAFPLAQCEQERVSFSGADADAEFSVDWQPELEDQRTPPLSLLSHRDAASFQSDSEMEFADFVFRHRLSQACVDELLRRWPWTGCPWKSYANLDAELQQFDNEWITSSTAEGHQFMHRDVISVIKQLQSAVPAEQVAFSLSSIREMWDGSWWRETLEEMAEAILPIFSYSDETTLRFGDKKLHPICIALASVSGKTRRRSKHMALLAFVPVLCSPVPKPTTHQRRELALARIKLLRDVYTIIYAPLSALPIINGARAMLGAVVGDMNELTSLSAVVASSATRYPCRFCLAPREKLIHCRQWPVRVYEVDGASAQMSRHGICPFWVALRLPHFSYQNLLPCAMHDVQLGVWKNFLQLLYQKLSSRSLTEIDQRAFRLSELHPNFFLLQHGLMGKKKLLSGIFSRFVERHELFVSPNSGSTARSSAGC